MIIMNTMVLGIGRSNHNYKKIIGFVNSLSKIHNVIHIDDGNIDNINRTINDKKIQLVFGETLQICNIDFSNVEMCFFWGDEKFESIIEVSKYFPKTKFIYGHKSLLYIDELFSKYVQKYSYESLDSNQTTKEYLVYNNYLNNCEKIDEIGTYKASNNFVLMYVPCCHSEIGKLQEIKYDVCYFGTTDNRPKVLQALKILNNMGYSIKSNLIDGHINPEDCIKYYSESICTLHEQVWPVDLEYPVRMGECSANGCKLFNFDYLKHFENEIPYFIPRYETITDIDIIVKYIEDVKRDNKIREEIYLNFNYTYDFSVNRILETFNKI